MEMKTGLREKTNEREMERGRERGKDGITLERVSSLRMNGTSC